MDSLNIFTNIDSVVALLRMAVDSELRKRKKLDHVHTIDVAVDLIKSSNNIIVLAGAGRIPKIIH